MRPDPPNVPAAENIRTIAELERRSSLEKTWDEKVSERISNVVGSLLFVAAHVVFFVAWASWNALAPEPLRFDRYPYGLLTFIVSMEGVLVATFVLVTQNRMSRDADRRAHLNLQVDLLTEQEMTVVLRLLRRVAERLEIEPGSEEETRARHLMGETNAYELMEGVKRTLQGREGTEGDENAGTSEAGGRGNR